MKHLMIPACVAAVAMLSGCETWPSASSCAASDIQCRMDRLEAAQQQAEQQAWLDRQPVACIRNGVATLCSR